MTKMNNAVSRFRNAERGFTMIELTTAIVLAIIPILAVSVLLVNGQNAWTDIYQSTTDRVHADSQAVLIAFGQTGRKSNRLSYALYNVNGNTFSLAAPLTTHPQEVVTGDAVEFRYWDVSRPDKSLLDTSRSATAYALFYLEGKTLKVDRGSYPPAAVSGGSRRATNDVKTEVLAENVTRLKFSHTTFSGVGQGAVRIDLELTNPDDGKTVSLKTSTLMRNIWPR